MKPLQKLMYCLIALLSCYQMNAQVEQDYKQYQKLDYPVIDSLMMLNYEKGAYEKCILLMQAGREKAKNDFGEIDSVFSEYTNNLGVFYDHLGQFDEALSCYTQSKNIDEKRLGKNHPNIAISLNNLAFLYQSMGDYNQALTLFTQAKNIYEKSSNNEHPDYGTSLNNLAMLHSDMGNYNEALPFLIQAKNIYEKLLGKEHPEFATSLNNLGLLYIDIGNYNQALPLLIQATNLREKVLGKEHPDYAQSLANLTVLYKRMGNYSQALPLLVLAKNIIEKGLGIEHPTFAQALSSLAELHNLMKNYKEALLLYTQAKNIIENVFGKEHPDFASSLNSLALSHINMGDYGKALELLTQSKNIREKVLGKEHPNVATTLNNLASLHEKMGNYSQALPLLIQAKNINEATFGKEHPEFANSLNNLAFLYERMGNYVAAWEVLYQVLSNLSALPIVAPLDNNLNRLKQIPYRSNEHVETMIASLEVAYNLLSKDKSISNSTEKKVLVADIAVDLLNKLRQGVSNEDDKLRILALNTDWLQKNLNVLKLDKDSDKAFHLSDQNKSVLLLQATKSEQVYQLGELPDSLVLMDKKLLKKQSQLEAKLVEKRSDTEKDSLRHELNHVNQDIDNFVSMIKQKYPKYHQLKYQQVTTKVDEIQGRLDEQTILLEYVISDSLVHIFSVDKKKVRWLVQAISKKELDYRIKSLHIVLSNYSLLSKKGTESYQKYTDLAYWFYQNLVEPALEHKEEIQNIVIVSDGELGHLPFEAFLVEPAPQSQTDYSKLHYLVVDYNISYNYSATLWKENLDAPAPQNNGQILAMAANYDLKLDSKLKEVRLPTDQWSREKLIPLPAARKEVEALQESFNGFFAFDKEASEKVVKEKAPQYAILHFATHGLLDVKQPVLSSLAFTEDNDSIESNFWQAHEISKLQLNANLVVLSACETGYGRFETGNGIASLARAFMYAGSSSLIVSLWQVNDFATSEIMKNLYNNLADGMKKDEALRQAKLKYMQSAKGIMAHPAFWSSFIMMGNTEPVSISRKGDSRGWIIGIAFVTLLGIGGLLWRKRRL